MEAGRHRRGNPSGTAEGFRKGAAARIKSLPFASFLNRLRQAREMACGSKEWPPFPSTLSFRTVLAVQGALRKIFSKSQKIFRRRCAPWTAPGRSENCSYTRERGPMARPSCCLPLVDQIFVRTHQKKILDTDWPSHGSRDSNGAECF